MKNVTVCLGCHSLTVNGKPEMSISAVIKLMVVARLNPETIIMDIHVCHDCRISFPKEYCDKIMEAVVSP